MKKIIYILMLFSLSITPAIGSEWSKQDTYRELAWTAILALDYKQTLTIVNDPSKYEEYNPLLGKHPSQRKVEIYFASCAIIHPIISYYLPPQYRKWWQYITIGVEAGAIGNSLRAGIGFAF